MKFFKEKTCNHQWKAAYISNIIQLDYDGCPARLVIAECIKCGKTKYQWWDDSNGLKAIELGEAYLLEWKKRKEELVVTYE